MDINLQSKVVEILIDGPTVFCNFCLLSKEKLNKIHENEDKSRPSLHVQLSETFLFGLQILEDPISDYVCLECKQAIKQAYNFIRNLKNTRKTFVTCLNSLDSKITTFGSNLNNTKHSFANVIFNLDDKVSKDDDIFLFKEEIEDIKSDPNGKYTDFDNKTNITDLSTSEQESALKAVCKYCFKIIDKNHLQNHIKDEHFNKILNINCSECDETPCCHTKYFKHLKMLRKTGDFKLICIDCGRIFKHKRQLVSHINRIHLNIVENQQYHLNRNHSVKNECQVCDYNFKNKIDMNHHELSCSKKESQFCCEKCSVSCDDSDEFIVHIDNCHNEHKCNINKECCVKQENNFNTEEDTKTVINKRSKTIRKNLNRKKKRKTRCCYLCTDQFDSLKDLLCHLQANHRPDEIYKCELCQKVYTTRNNYLSHIKSSTHLRKADPNFKPNFKCADCDTSYSTFLLLERHKNARHLKILPYTCEKCGKAFAAKSNLKLHLTRHFKQRNYQCNFCSAMFTEPTGLKSHILRQHAPENKKSACEVCGKTFISMSECKTHQLRQHSEKSFNCPLCEGKYHTMQNLRGHIKKVHLRNISLTEYMKENGFSKNLEEVFRDRRAACVVET